jgi:hypothetical protein
MGRRISFESAMLSSIPRCYYVYIHIHEDVTDTVKLKLCIKLCPTTVFRVTLSVQRITHHHYVYLLIITTHKIIYYISLNVLCNIKVSKTCQYKYQKAVITKYVVSQATQDYQARCQRCISSELLTLHNKHIKASLLLPFEQRI